MTLYLITGPPASGKTTWVREHAQHGDITIDYDTLAAVLSPLPDSHDQPSHVKAVTKAARQAAIDAAIQHAGHTDVYIIHGMPSQALTTRYRARGAHIISVDPGQDVVLKRCRDERPWQMTQAAKQWYATRHSDLTERPTDGQPATDLGAPSEHW